MKYAFSTLIILFAFTPTTASILETTKRDLMKTYTDQVEHEKTLFLKHYNLTENDLHNIEAINGLKKAQDASVMEEIDYYQSQTAPVAELKMLFSVAQRVFEESNLKLKHMFHDQDFPLEGVGIMYDNKSNTCTVLLNASLHHSNPDGFAAILRHECSHVVHQDNFTKQLMQCMAWTRSTEENDQIAQQMYAYCKAIETRADVYAAIHSPDHGQALIEFFETLPKKEVPTHPLPDERIALLKTIKFTLDEAKRQDKLQSQDLYIIL